MMGGGIINWYTVSGLVQARSSWSLLIKSNSKGNMGPTEGRALCSSYSMALRGLCEA